MLNREKNFPMRAFSTPPPSWKARRSSPIAPWSERNRRSPPAKADLFHVIHKVPSGDSPYVRAKHVQLIEKDPTRAVSLFWAAINSGDRVDSALKDMAVVMKQLDRADEAIEAIKSFRHLCPPESQESLDNVLVELYKRSGRVEDQIEMLKNKLKHIEEGIAFGGKRTKLARSQGKKIQITIEKEYSRLLGNLAWAYLQKDDYKAAEDSYRKALSIEPDRNKQCNLAICLMHMNRITEAKFLLQSIQSLSENGSIDESYANSFERAMQVMSELDPNSVLNPIAGNDERANDGRFKRNENCVGQRSCKKAYYDGSEFSGGETPRTPFTQPRRCPWSVNNGGQRRTPIMGHDNNTSRGFNRKLTFEHPMMSENRQSSINSDWRKKLEGYSPAVKGSGSQSGDEPTKLVASAAENLEQTHDFFSCHKSKKSWADMVEEEEEDDHDEEEFYDENIDSNIIRENLTPLSQIDKLSEKIESFELGGDGYHTQPDNAAAALSMGRRVRRSLRFSKHQNAESSENHCSSPIPNKALSFKNGSTHKSGNVMKLMRGNRLQVFQDITFERESPRP